MSQNEIIDNIKKFGRDQQIGAAGAVLAAISIFFPFVTVKLFGFSSSASLSDIGKGWFFFFAALAAGVLIYLGKNLYALAAAGLATLLFLTEFFDILGTDGAGLGFGAILGLIGIAGLLYGTIKLFLAERKTAA